jgi:hypothetical protein
MNSLSLNLWISHDWAGARPWVGLEGIGPPTGEPIRMSFSPQKGFNTNKYSVSSAVRVVDLRQSPRWRSRMWRTWAGVVTRALRLGGQLDVLPNSLKWCEVAYGRETLNFLATALVDIPAVTCQLHAPLKLETSVVLCDKTAHFRVSYCPQHKVHLCNDHAL